MTDKPTFRTQGKDETMSQMDEIRQRYMMDAQFKYRVDNLLKATNESTDASGKPLDYSVDNILMTYMKVASEQGIAIQDI